MENSFHPLSRGIQLLLTGLAVQGSLASYGINTKTEKPNVIIINADDLGFGDVSCNGSKTISTPNIDKLASKGVRFINLHSSASTCTPSRYSLLTGEYAWRKKGTGIAAGNAGAIIKPDQFTLADVFNNAGYNTGVIGKWHLGLGNETGTQDWNKEINPGPKQIGFNYSFILPATGDRVPCVYIENQKVINLDSNDPLYVSYKQNFEGEPTGKNNPELLKIKPSIGHNQSIVNGISRIGYMKGGKSARWKDEEIANVLTAKAIDFIDRNKKEPFFLYFATHDIHVPRVPNQRFAGKSGMGPRGDVILQFDWTVGEIVKTLRRLNIEKNTILIVTSDNGPVIDDGYQDQAAELLGQHKPSGKFKGGKYTIWEGGTRVPAILSWPGTVKPGISDKLLCQIDFTASFATLLHQAIPKGGAPDSKNTLDELLNRGGNGHDYLVLESGRQNLAIVKGFWKYIESGKRGNNTGKLFDLSNDYAEQNNLEQDNPSIADDLKNKLNQLKAQGFE